VLTLEWRKHTDETRERKPSKHKAFSNDYKYTAGSQEETIHTDTDKASQGEREREITESEVGSEKEYKRKRMSRGERARERKESQRKPIQPTDKQGYRREER
jgi:hypothetical protein